MSRSWCEARGRRARAVAALRAPRSRRATRTSSRSCGRRCRAGSSSCSTRGAVPGGGRRDVLRERARARPASAASVADPRRVDARRGLRDRGGRARRPARDRVGALGRGRRGAAARELDGVADRRARYVCELVALSPDGEERRGTGDPRGRDRDRAPRRGGLRLRPDLRPGSARSAPSPSSGTPGSAATPTAPAPPPRSCVRLSHAITGLVRCQRRVWHVSRRVWHRTWPFRPGRRRPPRRGGRATS